MRLFLSINIEVADCELLAIVGQVGCGKSSLISTMLGETRKLQGQVTLKVYLACVSCILSSLKTIQSEKITSDHFYELFGPPHTKTLKLTLVSISLQEKVFCLGSHSICSSASMDTKCHFKRQHIIWKNP